MGTLISVVHSTPTINTFPWIVTPRTHLHNDHHLMLPFYFFGKRCYHSLQHPNHTKQQTHTWLLTTCTWNNHQKRNSTLYLSYSNLHCWAVPFFIQSSTQFSLIIIPTSPSACLPTAGKTISTSYVALKVTRYPRVRMMQELVRINNNKEVGSHEKDNGDSNEDDPNNPNNIFRETLRFPSCFFDLQP